MAYRRIFLIVLDGLGVGGAPDAAAFGDGGSDTLKHVLAASPVDLPHLAGLGLGSLYAPALSRLHYCSKPRAHYCRLTELGAGKDTTTGHWELMGLVRTTPAPVFPQGFPREFLAEFCRRTGRGVIGNKPASGTQIIQELGGQHLASGKLIVYTSADSVFQVAAHVDVVPLQELLTICQTAREMLNGELAVDRVIARPFKGDAAGGFLRTVDRRDFSLLPPAPTVLDELMAAGLATIGVGKIADIFAGAGIAHSMPEHGNINLMQAVSKLAEQTTGEPLQDGLRDWQGLAFCNLVDFDMLYGHRNNPAGYAEALVEFDQWLGGFLEAMQDSDLLMITADHGNDPTTPSTDHSREQVPLLITSRKIARDVGRRLDPPAGFMHVGATIAAGLGVNSALDGVDLLNDKVTRT